MKRVAIYARVSTADQNPDPQLGALMDYAARRGLLVVGQFVDTVTGDLVRRRHAKRDPAFQELMKAAFERRFDCVLVWKYDRFARSLSGLVEALQTFAALGVDFISITQDIDTTTPMGRFFFHVIASFAEFERELIVERTRAGLDHARSRGVVFGRPRDRALEARVVELRESGLSLRAIAERVRRSPAGVLKIVARSKIMPAESQ